MKKFILTLLLAIMASSELDNNTEALAAAAATHPPSTTGSGVHGAETNIAAVNANENDDPPSEIPLLPAHDPNLDVPRYKLGDKIKLDAMGPIIINPDGTTRQITNWDKMTEHERATAWRRISKRNEERRRILLEQQQQQQAAAEEQEDTTETQEL